MRGRPAKEWIEAVPLALDFYRLIGETIKPVIEVLDRVIELNSPSSKHH